MLFCETRGRKATSLSLWAATFFIKSHRKWLKLDFSKVSLDQCDGLDNGMLYNLQRLQCGVPNPTPILPPPQQSSLSSHQWLWFYTRHNRGRRIYCRLRNGFKHTFHFSSNTSLRTHVVCVCMSDQLHEQDSRYAGHSCYIELSATLNDWLSALLPGGSDTAHQLHF